MPTRELAYASVRLYDVGAGDPIVTTRQYARHDILGKCWKAGAFNFQTSGLPNLEFLEGIGLTCRPFPVPKDTRLSHFTTSGGLWEEERPIAGGPRVYRITQYNTAPGVTYAATSTYNLPADPHLEFALVLPETPSDWDYNALPPFVRIELGGGTWGIHFQNGEAYLVRNVGGSWQGVQELPPPPVRIGNSADNTLRVWLRCLRGQIGVSFDRGRNYKWFGFPDGSAATIPAGKLTLRGQGGEVTFGVNQLLYSAGTWDSHVQDMLEARLGAVPVITGRYFAPIGTTVGFADLSVPEQRRSQYRATLTPTSTSLGTPGWSVYTAPVLASVTFRYPPNTEYLGEIWSTPWDQWIDEITVGEPDKLDDGKATIRLRVDASVPFEENLRGRKVQIVLGYVLEDDTLEEHVLFTGYIADDPISWDELSQVVVEITVENPTLRFRESEWTVLEQLPLGGLTPNAAADEILASEGLNASYRNWNIAGSYWPLPSGSPEEPFELTRPREAKWTTLARIFQYQGLEAGADRDGTLISLPQEYVESTVSWVYRATPTDSLDVREQYESISTRRNYRDAATAILTYGWNEFGQLVLATAVDREAETNVACGRFNSWRKLVQEEIPGSPDAGLMLLRTQALAYQHLRIHEDADVIAPVHFGLKRRQRVAVYGAAGARIPDGTEFVILSLQHHVKVQQGLTTLKTTAGLRRLPE